MDACDRQSDVPIEGTQPASGPPADELDSWLAWRRSGDEAARQTLLDLHMPYARVIAAMVYSRRTTDEIEFDDYLQLARIGLLEAFTRYDPLGGAQFRTYAASRIRGAVLDGLERLTERQQQLRLRRRILAERTASVAARSRRPVDESSAGGQDDGTPARGRLEGFAAKGSNLFEYLAEVGVGLAVGFVLDGTGMYESGDDSAGGADPLYGAVELRQTRKQLEALILQLPPPERRVIQLHYVHGHAFEDIASDMGLTKGRISQIHKKAITTLRRLLADRRTCDRAF